MSQTVDRPGDLGRNVRQVCVQATITPTSDGNLMICLLFLEKKFSENVMH